MVDTFDTVTASSMHASSHKEHRSTGTRPLTGALVGKSQAFLQLLQLVERVAPTTKAILITGPTGAGKEIFAQKIHAMSLKPDQPFVDLNCGAIPEHLFEAELFGHVRGAFTGAQTDRDGFFTTANEGTLFFDEIAELPSPLQAKLLRVLETRNFRPVGSNTNQRFHGRIIAATHQDLPQLVKSRKFREDL